MKYVKKLWILLLVCVMCAGCSASVFDGSMTGDQDHFDIDFKTLNTAYEHKLEMIQGECITVHTEKQAGVLKITIQDAAEHVIYEGNGEVTDDFTVQIPEDGTYVVQVEGNNARGHVTFTRKQP